MRQINANDCESILLGRQGENLATKVIFDISEWKATYGNGTAKLMYRSPNSTTISEVAVTVDGNYVFWNVTSAYTAISSGCGECELRYYSGDTLVKSRTWMTFVDAAMDVPEGSTLPQPNQSWVDQVVKIGVDAETAKKEAEAAASSADTAKKAAERSASDAQTAADRAEKATVNTPKVQNGTWWVYDQTAGAYEDSGIAATGPMGTITKIKRTAGTGAAGSLDTYTVTCSDGAKFTFTVQNGKDGSGTGNMDASVYDPTGKAQDIFAYCDAAIGNSIAASY